MFKHIFLTGTNQQLKSKMIDLLLVNQAFSGFYIQPYEVNQKERGQFLHSYIPVEGYDNDLPISVYMNKDKTVMIPDILDHFGAMILSNSRHHQATIIKMDYLALSKQKSLAFLEEFDRCLYSDKHIIGSLECLNDEVSALVFTNNSSCILEINEENQEQMLVNLKRIMATWSQ